MHFLRVATSSKRSSKFIVVAATFSPRSLGRSGRRGQREEGVFQSALTKSETKEFFFFNRPPPPPQHTATVSPFYYMVTKCKYLDSSGAARKNLAGREESGNIAFFPSLSTRKSKEGKTRKRKSAKKRRRTYSFLGLTKEGAVTRRKSQIISIPRNPLPSFLSSLTWQLPSFPRVR